MKLKELLLRRTMPIVINSYNQRFYLKNMINKLLSFNFKNIYIIDNNSNSLALINYYQELASNPFVTVIYYGANLGPRSFHLNGYSDIFGNLPHIYSDPDLDFDFMSDCYLEYLLNLSHKYKICKVGSALEIPDETIGKKDLKLKINGKEYSVKEWESQFWINEIEKDIYLAPIDTTFHLFNPQYYQSGEPYVTGIRVGAVGFVAKHLPWYESNNSEEIEEMLIYKKTQTGWNNY
jgi:hypothetical protein